MEEKPNEYEDLHHEVGEDFEEPYEESEDEGYPYDDYYLAEPEASLEEDEQDYEDEEIEKPPARKRSHSKTKSKKSTSNKGSKKSPGRKLNAKSKLLILRAFRSSKLSAKVFGPLVGVSGAAIYKWDRAFRKHGPAGLEGHKQGAPSGTRLPVATQQAILMLKAEHVEWGCQRIHDVLLRSQGFSASPGAIRRVLFDNGYEVVEEGVSRHPDKPRRFERARPQEMYQVDIFTFMLKRQNYRVHLVAYMDDCSRYIVSYGLTTKATSAWAQEVLGEAISLYGPPKEVLTDQGPQFHTWRGTSSYNKYLNRCGIKQIVARAHHPQTLGKVERFWQTLWNECVQRAIFKDINDARARIGQFIGWYNFKRTHQGIGGMYPADRFFGAETAVRKNIEERVAANALEIARHGQPRKPFYLSGRVGDEAISLHAEGDKVVLTKDDGKREEVDLSATGRPVFGSQADGDEESTEEEPSDPQSTNKTPLCSTEVNDEND